MDSDDCTIICIDKQDKDSLTMNYFKNVVYFLRGGDNRKLNIIQQSQILQTIKQDWFSKSFYLYNPHEAEQRIKAWRRDLPHINPYYAVKAGPFQQIIKTLLDKGVRMDCASENQINKCLNLRGSPENIVYSNPNKEQKDLVFANKVGIKLTVADTLSEIRKIKELAPSMHILWRISVQQNQDDRLSCTFSNKFGDNIETQAQIQKRMGEIKIMGINLKGIHFHCGSGMHGATGFNRGVELAKKCIKIGRKMGHEMSILDVGGGFPAGKIQSSILNPLNAINNKELKLNVIAQPGRYFCSKSFYLLARVIGKNQKNGRPSYFLNDSIYHSFRLTEADSFYFENSTDQFYSQIDCNGISKQCEATHIATLVGMTCDGTDIITRNIDVPRTLKIGDWLCIGGMGAYTYSCLGSFNGMTVSEEVKILNFALPEDT